MHRKYFLHSHPNSYFFALTQEGEDWQKEFSSVFDAVTYAGTLPGSEEATLTVFNAAGTRLVELRVRAEALTTP